jgi:hypothetical protein
MSYSAKRFKNSYKRDINNDVIDFENKEITESVYWDGTLKHYYDEGDSFYDMFGSCGYEDCCPGSMSLKSIMYSFLAGLLHKLDIQSAEDLMESDYYR